MEPYLHRVVGVYDTQPPAEQARQQLLALGVPAAQIRLLASGVVGAVVGTQRSQGDLPRLVKAALAGGQVVLVVHAHTEAETTLARQVVGQHTQLLGEPDTAPLLSAG